MPTPGGRQRKQDEAGGVSMGGKGRPVLEVDLGQLFTKLDFCTLALQRNHGFFRILAAPRLTVSSVRILHTHAHTHTHTYNKEIQESAKAVPTSTRSKMEHVCDNKRAG